MDVDSSILKTDVDDFVELLKKKGKMTIVQAAKELRLSEATIEAWTDFLVEEGIIGIEYKFTTPYIYMDIQTQSNSTELIVGMETKEQFLEKAAKRKISQYDALTLWAKYLSQNFEKIKSTFMAKAKSRGIPNEKAEDLWSKYYNHLRKG